MDFEKILEKFYDSLGIPMSLYQGELKIKGLGCEGISKKAVTYILGNYKERKESLFFAASLNDMYAGMIRIDSNTYLLVGPVLAYPCTAIRAKQIQKSINLPDAQYENLYRWLTDIPCMELRRFVSTLELMNLVITGTDRKAVEVEFRSKTEIGYAEYEEIFSFEKLESKYKTRILTDIEYGNIEDLEKMLHTWYLTDEKSTPVVVDNRLNSMRVIFIVLIVLSEQAAVRGGIAEEVAAAMSNQFFSYVYKFRTSKEFMSYFKKVIFSFAKKVKEMQVIDTDSYLVRKIDKEIQKYMHEKITPEIVARNLNMNVSYLCQHFKSHTGKTISEYVNEIKVKEAKRLLCSTELSLVEISDSLGYSTQNYFQRVFKKVTGETPASFRKAAKLEKIKI